MLSGMHVLILRAVSVARVSREVIVAPPAASHPDRLTGRNSLFPRLFLTGFARYNAGRFPYCRPRFTGRQATRPRAPGAVTKVDR